MKNETFISPLEDFAFKQIFGEQRNIDITRAFLKALLDVPAAEYDKLTVVNPNLGTVLRRGKTGVVDVKLTCKSGKIIHIELQVEKRANMRNRVTYYNDRQISDQLNWGDDYNKLHQVISIVICNHILLEEEETYLTEYRMRNDKNRSFTNLKRMIILELPKLPETNDGTIWPWLRFLLCKKKEEFEMLAKKYPELEKPVNYAKKMTLFQRWRDIQFHKNLAKVDERNLHLQWEIDAREKGHAEGHAEGLEKGITEGLEKGIAEGIAEGREKEKLENARKMKALGYSSEEIHAITGLSVNDIG